MEGKNREFGDIENRRQKSIIVRRIDHIRYLLSLKCVYITTIND